MDSYSVYKDQSVERVLCHYDPGSEEDGHRDGRNCVLKEVVTHVDIVLYLSLSITFSHVPSKIPNPKYPIRTSLWLVKKATGMVYVPSDPLHHINTPVLLPL